MSGISNIRQAQPHGACCFRHLFYIINNKRVVLWKPNDSALYLNQSRWKYNNLSNSGWLDNESAHCLSLQDKVETCRTQSEAGDQSEWMSG